MPDSMLKHRIELWLDKREGNPYAYVALPGGNLLCIGTQEEVSKAGVQEIGDMVLSAVQINKFLDIESGKGRVRH